MTGEQTILCKIINQVHSIESKTYSLEEYDVIKRNFDRTKVYFQELGLHIHNPINERYDATRTDCEASISGASTIDLEIVEVIKPIIYYRSDSNNTILQRGIVIVEGKGSK